MSWFSPYSNTENEDHLQEDEKEKNAVQAMRALVEKQDPSSKDFDDLMIRRFLRARDHDIEKGCGLFLKYLNWRRKFLPNGYISPAEISNDLAQKKLFMQGLDKTGRPIVVVFGGKHRPDKTSLDEFKRFVVFVLERISARMPSGCEKFTAIADLEGWGYTSSDVRGYIASLSILQDCYPERLGKLLVVHVPYLFMTAWKGVYPFIDEKTRKKIVFVEDKKLESTLLEDIDENQLPDVYGGKLPLVPIEDC
ncbi:phosphatidylinositol transfer protein 3-like [Impatiens glandulifera]|uniref:phosphatidylinositol transfer protein 3-like n=1 Tax=Impatiens glandulifera TaxID=253017 RepID=UPI001FB16904|nr:phosphatidylinositol transfer protein 3-like [Impatiens glandulifera]